MVQIMAGGKRRSALMRGFEEVLEKIEYRVAAFDASAAQEASDLMASRHKRGRPGELRDTMIAGIAVAQHATLATRNTAHFDDISVPVVNPWTA
jgi:predicted nucleic acid-binding protein